MQGKKNINLYGYKSNTFGSGKKVIKNIEKNLHD